MEGIPMRTTWIILLASVLVLSNASISEALICKKSNGLKETCSSNSQVCTSFSVFSGSFQGCMETLAGDGSNSCDLVIQLDPQACCCTTDECNEVGIKCGKPKRLLQEAETPPPTTYARINGGYCAVPKSFNGEFTVPCDFGSADGWTYTDGSITLTNIQGCITVGEAEPLNGLELLSASDFWCPYALADEILYDATDDENWGSCECSACRINPNANPGGIELTGLCDFGDSGVWSYVAEDGTTTSNISGCVTVEQFAPLAWEEMGVSPSTRWCPSLLTPENTYDLRDLEESQHWGVCECANDVISTLVPTVMPTKSPSLITSAPTGVYTADGQYCEIQADTVAPLTSGQCNFGSTGEWDYKGVDLLVDEGLVGCVPVGEFPPRLENDARFIDENTIWCPGYNGLDNTDTYNISDLSTSLNWGVCACESCRVTDESATIPFGGGAKSGLCNFGTDPDKVWKYLSDGVAVNMTQCPLISEYPPFGVNLSAIDPSTTRWCPSGPFSLHNNVYDTSDTVSRLKWGLCQCVQTSPPSIFIDTDQPSLTPTRSQPTHSPTKSAPSRTPTRSSPTKSPTNQPTTRQPTNSPFSDLDTLSPSTSPLVFDTTCLITGTTSNSVARNGSVCGFGSSTWQYQSGSVSSGFMSGCVSVGAFPPLGSDGLDETLLWCPSIEGLNSQSIYDPQATLPELEPMAWGFCTCENCEISVIDGDTGPVQSGACDFGPNRQWKYLSLEGGELLSFVGCASIDEARPLLPDNVVFPAGTKWCPAVGGLTSDYIYTFIGEFNDPSQWGLCLCESTIPPTPQTDSPVPEPTAFGATRKPSRTPTRKPSTPFPTSDAPTSKLPTLQPTSSTPTLKPSTLQPTASPTCCSVVAGGSISPGEGVTCNFGSKGKWTYQAVSASDKLTSCVAIDDFVPFGSSGLRNQGLKWCPTNLPSGLTDGDVYGFFNPNTRSNWGLCECPCIATESPKTKQPTLPPNQLGRLALFIQTDHSGSIRLANKQCRQQTGGQMTCWNLLSSFVRNLVGNVTSTLGGPQNFRLFLSSFGCVNGNPHTKTLSDGLTMPGDEKGVDNALKRLAGLKESNMYGTCPSKGAEKMAPYMKGLSKDWGIAYYIVSDGRVQGIDELQFTRAIRIVKDSMGKRPGRNVCASTVGYADSQALKRLLRTDCVIPAADFIEIASRPFSERIAYSLVQNPDVPEIIVKQPTTPSGSLPPASPGSEKPVGPESNPLSPQAPQGGAQSEQGSPVVLGASFAVIGLCVTGGILFVVKRRNSRRRYVPKQHRHPDEVYWIDNPARAPSPAPEGPSAGYTGSQPRRRSRASSEIGFINLPPPPPTPKDSSTPPPPPSPTSGFEEIDLGMGSPHPSLRNPSPSPSRNEKSSTNFIELDPKDLPPPPKMPPVAMFSRKYTFGSPGIEDETEKSRKSINPSSPDRLERVKMQLSPFSSGGKTTRQPPPGSPLVAYQPINDPQSPSQSPSSATRFDGFRPVALLTNKPISPQKLVRPTPSFQVDTPLQGEKRYAAFSSDTPAAFRSLESSFEDDSSRSLSPVRGVGKKKESF